MEKNIYQFNGGKIKKIIPETFNKEIDMQDLLEQMIREEKRLFQHKVIAYKREFSTNSGRPDFLLINEDNELIIIECKLVKNSGSRRKVVAQLLDYSANYEDIVPDKTWEMIVETDFDDYEAKEPILYIITDGIEKQLHKIYTYLSKRGIEININTINKFIINKETYFTITPHFTDEDKIEENKKLESQINIFIDSFNENKEIVKEIIELTKKNQFTRIKKNKRKRLSIHMINDDNKFPLWVSNYGIRNISFENISIPKSTFCPCDEKIYDKIISKLKENLKEKIVEYYHDDVAYYIKLEDIDEKIYSNILKIIEEEI